MCWALFFYLPFYQIETTGTKLSVTRKKRCSAFFVFSAPFFTKCLILDLGIFSLWCGLLGAEVTMARRHGWELPAHHFQNIALGVYSFLALSVFILYVRCTAIDPADPGILINIEDDFATNSPKLSYNSQPKPLFPIKFPTIKPCTGLLFFFSFLSRELKRVSNCC
jgi:hypothetical protein